LRNLFLHVGYAQYDADVTAVAPRTGKIINNDRKRRKFVRYTTLCI